MSVPATLDERRDNCLCRKISTMTELQNCLPERARLFFIRLRNSKWEESRQSYQEQLSTSRRNGAARGVIHSGFQRKAEWDLAIEHIGDRAVGYFQAGIEACTLYEIPLTQPLCQCIEVAVKDFLIVQQKNALTNAAKSVPGAPPIPLASSAQELHSRPLPRYNEILIDLEKARVESEKVMAQRMASTAVNSQVVNSAKRQRKGNRPDVVNVLIASPSDVAEEREAVTAAIYVWNASHSESTQVLLNPIRWETHSYPESGDRPQGLLNRQIVETGDFLIGIFGNRLGSPTGIAESGTIEEIEQFRRAGKYVALYFSEADVPRNADRAQLDAVENYRRERQKDTLYGVFHSAHELKGKAQQDLSKIIARVGAALQIGMWTNVASTPHSMAPSVPLKLDVEITDGSETGSILQVQANRPITVTQIDYLDYQNIRISTEKLKVEGQQLSIKLPHAELVKIWNLRPNGVVPIHFRLHVLDGENNRIETIDAGLQEAWKMVGSASTFYFQILA